MPYTHPGPFLPGHAAGQLQQQNDQLRSIVAALLFHFLPQPEQRGVDITLTPDELERPIGWTLAVYEGLGFGVRPPLRLVMTRPQSTVTGAVVADRGELPAGKVVPGEVEHGGEGEPAADSESSRAFPAGSQLGGDQLRG